MPLDCLARPRPARSAPGFFRSPLRGPWLTSALGSILLVLIAIVATTGFLSHAAYMPDLPGNAIVPADRDLPLTFDWPTSPSWLYALNQGLHTNVGLVAIPFLLAKLWSVIPRLFAWPPVTSPAQAIERLSIALLVSSAVFQLATGVANAQYWYPFKFNFVVAHYYGAIVFVASLVAARDRQDAGGPARLPRARRAQAAARQPREHAARARGRAGRDRPGGADDLAPRPVRLRRRGRAARCWSATSASRSAGRCASWRSSRRGARTSRSTRPRRGRGRHAGRWPAPGYQLVLRAGDAGRRAHARGPARAAAAHGAAADRVRRGLVDDAGVDRRAAVGARRARGRARGERRCSSSRCSRRACCAAPR